MHSTAAVLLLSYALALNEFAHGATTCSSACGEVYAPVCGSDGQTYSNQCYFDNAKCTTGNTDLTIVYEGECTTSSSGSTSASSDSTSASSGSTSASSGSSAVCAQEFACLDVYEPVCGSDGVTYSNDCELRRAICTNPEITMASNGECASSSSSSSGSAEVEETGADADTRDSGASGSSCSNMCTKEYLPVCGSDGVSYSNTCVFTNAQCQNSSLTKVSDGTCGSSSGGDDSSASTITNTVLVAMTVCLGFVINAMV